MKTQIKALLITLALVMLPMSAFADDVKKEQRAESVESSVSDTWLEASIVTAYTLNRHLNPFELEVEVNNGEATLAGIVGESVDRELAEQLALSVDGVKSVNNSIVVDEAKASMSSKNREKDHSRGFAQSFQDATSVATVKSKLLWNRHTSGMDINVDAKNNQVTLRGTVDTEAQKDLAEALAKNTEDVRSVNNELAVKKNGQMKKEMESASEAISDSWITTKVTSSLVFSANVDSSDIEIDTKNGIVTLKGNVESESEKELVTKITEDVRGVKKVDNNLQVAQG